MSVPRQLKAVHRDRLEAGEKLEQLGRKIRKAEPDFLPYAKALSLEEIKQVAHDANATLLLFRVAEFGSVVFLVFPDGKTDAVQIDTFDTDTLSQLMVTFEDGQPVTGWSVLYIQKHLGKWTTFMEAALERLYVELMEPVHGRLRELSPHMNGSTRLVIVPNRALTILPLHACWWKENDVRKYLLDEYVCAYAPSLYILNLTLKRKTKLEPQDRILGFANPHFDDPKLNLLFSEWECREIQKLFGNDRCRVLWREQATKEQFLADASQSQILHFSCHGMYELAMPLQSSLFLADAALEAGEIMSNLDLSNTWLAVLSACETSLGDFRNRTDEQYGLPLGFLVAGVATVWGTLWKVDDLSTALIMKKAYQNLKAGMNKPEALRAAQISVRDMTPTEIHSVIEAAQASARSGAREKSLSRTYQWAGMQCVGI
jgi:CHAT domain-containing protein